MVNLTEVPCGFAAPGSLPLPAEDSLDGGIIYIPGPPSPPPPERGPDLPPPPGPPQPPPFQPGIPGQPPGGNPPFGGPVIPPIPVDPSGGGQDPPPEDPLEPSGGPITPSPSGFESSAQEYLYRNLVYTPTPSGEDVGVDGSGVFEHRRDYSLQRVLEGVVGPIGLIYRYFNDLVDSKLEDSVVKPLEEAFRSIRYVDGRLVGKNRFYDAMRDIIARDDVDNIDTNYISNLVDALVEDTNVGIAPINRAVFGVETSSLVENRAVDLTAPPLNEEDFPDADVFTGVGIAKENGLPLDPLEYSDVRAETLKLWYIPPTDIRAFVPVTDSSGVEVSAAGVNDNDTFVVCDSDGTEVVINLAPGNVFNVCQDGKTCKVALNTQLNRAKVLPNKVKSLVNHHIGIDSAIEYRVSSNLSNQYEVSGSQDTALNASYNFLLNVSSMESIPGDNVYENKTSALYIVPSNSQFITEMEFRAFPWVVLTLDHNDPIFAHINSTSIHEFIFSQFSLEKFPDLGQNDLFVRQIPRGITLIPSDLTEVKLFGGRSTLEEWNVRSVQFVQSPDKTFNLTGMLQHPHRADYAFPENDIYNNLNTQAFKFAFVTSSVLLNSFYLSGGEPLPRATPPLKTVADMVSQLSSNYIVSSGLTWNDILSRVDQSTVLSYDKDFSPTMKSKIETGNILGVKIYEPSGEIPELIGSLKDGGTEIEVLHSYA